MCTHDEILCGFGILLQVKDCYVNLPHVWAAFKSCLVDSDNMLKKHKEKFRSGLLQDADDFKRTVTEIADMFEAEGPFTSDASQEQVRLYLSCTL